MFVVPVIAESQAEIYIQRIFSTTTPSLCQPKVKCNNFIISNRKYSKCKVTSRSASGLREKHVARILSYVICYVNAVICDQQNKSSQPGLETRYILIKILSIAITVFHMNNAALSIIDED